MLLINSKQDLINEFRERSDLRVLVATEVASEGVDLQFSRLLINYDLPWNPMRIEQRIGRVDRIGQIKTVRAFNLILQNSVEFRVRKVLEEKLAIILREFGVDKVSDVLDSWNTEKVQFVEILEAAQMLQQAEQNLAEQEVKLRQEEEKVTKFKREDSGLRFTITCLVAFTVFQAGLLIWIATHR